MRLALMAIVLLAAGVALALWPVCVPLPSEELVSVKPSLAERTDKDFYLRVFQQRAGQWYQCKTRISRALFF